MDYSTVEIDDILIEDIFDLKKDQSKLVFIFQRFGLLPKMRKCESCKSDMLLKRENNIDSYIFRCYSCNKKTSLRKGTFF